MQTKLDNMSLQDMLFLRKQFLLGNKWLLCMELKLNQLSLKNYKCNHLGNCCSRQQKKDLLH